MFCLFLVLKEKLVIDEHKGKDDSSQLTPPSLFIATPRGPTFGGGLDLCIANNSNVAPGSYSNMGTSFNFKMFDSGTTGAFNFLISLNVCEQNIERNK